MKISASLQRRLAWFNLPTAVLITLLQRSPVVRVATAIEEMIAASPISNLLKSVATAAASLGAINSMAGATPLVPSAGTESGITVTTGTAVSVAYTANSPLGPAASWSVAGTVPGLNFTNLSSSSFLMSGTPTTVGSYSLTVSAFGPNAGERIDYPYTVTVTAGGGNTAPAFTTQPASQSVNIGANVTFTVVVAGTPAPTLQWKKGSSDITGQTGTTLALNNVQTGDAATYTVVATNSAGAATSTGAVLQVSAATAPPAFTTQPASQSVAAGATVTFTVVVTGSPTPAIQWKKGAADITGQTGSTLTLTNVQAGDAATYMAVATNASGSVNSTGAVLTVGPSSTPAITVQPAPHTVAQGGSIVFGVEVTGGGLTYQWKKDGANVGGATSSQLLLTNVQAGNAGVYTVTATNGSGSVTSTGAALSVVATGDPGRLINVSVRIISGADANVLIMGFVTGGAGTTGTKQLLIRGIGPKLIDFGVPGTMADPILEIFPQGGATPLVTNDNWGGDAAVVAKANQLGAFPLTDNASKDAALVTSLDSGPYSAKVRGAANTTGTVLAEVYDGNPAVYNPATPRLVNISARVAMTNDNPLIAGFVVGGSTAKTVLIRGIGPALTGFGVPGAMSDPKLELFAGETSILSNDNWGGSTVIANAGSSVGAFALTDIAGKDAVLLVTLNPGVYSAKVLGVNNSSGITLVEIYEIP